MRMNKSRFSFAIIIFFMVFISSCIPLKPSLEGAEQSFSDDGSFENEFDSYNLNWRDNSLDAYSARFDQLIKISDDGSEDFFLGGSCVAFGENRLTYLQKHLNAKDLDKCWDEVIIVTDQREVRNERLQFPFTPDSHNQAWVIGDVYGSNHIICINVELSVANELMYHLFEVDEELKVVNDFYADCLRKDAWEEPEGLYQDKDGNIHVLTSLTDEEFSRYYVFRPDGKLIGQCILDMSAWGGKAVSDFRFRPMGDGRLAIQRPLTDDQGRICGTELFQKDVDTGRETTLLTQDIKVTEDILYYQLWDERTILYVNRVGLFKCDKSWENPEILYRWSNHGISFAGGGIRVLNNDDISVYYGNNNGYHYMILTPTVEKTEITEISFVTNQTFVFQPLVDEFNVGHPSCHIELMSCKDKTALLTALISGRGPVLIDTALIGFEEQERMWEPLDEMLKTTGLESELNEKALACCKVNGKTLGLVGDYGVNTVITMKQEVSDGWTQEDFISIIESESSIKVVFPPVPLNYGGNTLIFEYLMHGLNDNYLLSDEGAKRLNEGNLKRVFRVAEKYCRDEDYESASTLVRNGQALCVETHIRGLDELLSNERIYGENVRYVGYPSVNGGTHFVSVDSPVSMRKNATKEEKAVAFMFLKEWMSYEGQKVFSQRNINYGISIREDLREEQIESVIQRELENYSGVSERARKAFEEGLRLKETFMLTMIKEARVQECLPYDLKSLMWDELTEYFRGDITQEQVTDHLQNRIRLYLEENK